MSNIFSYNRLSNVTARQTAVCHVLCLHVIGSVTDGLVVCRSELTDFMCRLLLDIHISRKDKCQQFFSERELLAETWFKKNK